MVPIEQEPYIGMWRDRSDIKAAAAWVRQLRAAQWSRADARRGISQSRRAAPASQE
jgi:hypothetical protein